MKLLQPTTPEPRTEVLVRCSQCNEWCDDLGLHPLCFECSAGSFVASAFLHIFRDRPAPSPELRKKLERYRVGTKKKRKRPKNRNRNRRRRQKRQSQRR